MKDILGKAIASYHQGNCIDQLWINNTYGEPDEMPLEYYFRDKEGMPELELFALKHCRGKILDIGAAAGAHSLILQDLKQEVKALDISPELVKTMKLRGVKNVIEANIFKWETKDKFDTLLLLMNGIGISQDLKGLAQLLKVFKGLLTGKGQVLFDSSDVSYLYEKDIPKGRYHGEIDFQYEYQKEKGDWFSWLYLGFDTLRVESKKAGYNAELLAQDEDEHYLARLTLI
jgi:hypothetical protein